MPATVTESAQEAHAFQDRMLEGVSRTFALTIPQLPAPLERSVGNAYLLCRILDTIEDEPDLSGTEKEELLGQFEAVVEGTVRAEDFAGELAPKLTEATNPAEHELVRKTEHVIRITHSLPAGEREALRKCVRTMASGMSEIQRGRCGDGANLRDIGDLDRYCYYVAGCVGEMLTELFCLHEPRLAPRRETMMRLAASFGEGLQLTNIIKDIWTDRERRDCWLPREIFPPPGELDPGGDERFRSGVRLLVAHARQHLENARDYTLLLPADQPGMRKFCLLALGMALLTLRKINGNPSFSDGAEVKISRRSVRITVGMTHLLVRRDRALRLLFRQLAKPLPTP